jgi:cytidine deaminase
MKISGKYNFPVRKTVFLNKFCTMNSKEIIIVYQEHESIETLPTVLKLLVLAARQASANAYAPYSGFKVGAAVQLKSGMVVTGNNQENAAYPAGLCAERTALFYAGANFPDDPVEAIAVAASSTSGWLNEPVKPCGSCRQVMLETEGRSSKPITIILDGRQSVILIEGADSLLPLNFKKDSLK